MSKVVLITGASKGIGKAIAELLSKEHSVAFTARSEDALRALETSIGKDKALALPGDACNEADVRAAVEATLAKFGRIDALVNNVGMGIFKRVDQFSLEEFNQVQEINMVSTFLFTKYVAPRLIEQKAGSIINIASVAGLNGFRAGAAYAASKFAMVGFTESVREDLKGFGIAVTAVCPGGVRTEFGGKEISERALKSEYLLEPEDVARTVRYLIEESETANAKLIELKPRRRADYRGN